MRWIDELNELHLQLLREATLRHYQPGRIETLLSFVPELRRLGIEEVAVSDLVSRNLIRPASVGGVHYNQGENWATPLGIEFLNFIVDPLVSDEPT